MKRNTIEMHGDRLPHVCGWCGKRTKSAKACGDCQGIEAHLRRVPDEQHALPEGHWAPRGAIVVWVEGPEPTPGGRAKCGTPGGYYSHLRHARDEPCWDCRVAHTMAAFEGCGEAVA